MTVVELPGVELGERNVVLKIWVIFTLLLIFVEQSGLCGHKTTTTTYYELSFVICKIDMYQCAVLF